MALCSRLVRPLPAACNCGHTPRAPLRPDARLARRVRSRAADSTGCRFHPAISGAAPARCLHGGETQRAAQLPLVAVARWASWTFFSSQAQPLQGATEGRGTDLQAGLSGDARL